MLRNALCTIRLPGDDDKCCRPGKMIARSLCSTQKRHTKGKRYMPNNTTQLKSHLKRFMFYFRRSVRRPNRNNSGDTQAADDLQEPQMQHRLFVCCTWRNTDLLLHEHALPLQTGADTSLPRCRPERSMRHLASKPNEQHRKQPWPESAGFEKIARHVRARQYD